LHHVFVVFAESAIAAEPSESSFHYPGQARDLEGALPSFDDRGNPKYFGYERGVTYYNLMSNQFTGLNTIVVPGTLRDSLFLLAVVLEQQTEVQPTEIMTDTGAYTDVVFGLFWLLGYRFSPRIADIGGARYWRIDSSADYGLLNGIGTSSHQYQTNHRELGRHAPPGWLSQTRGGPSDVRHANAANRRQTDKTGPGDRGIRSH
jgi:hypothetical protein